MSCLAHQWTRRLKLSLAFLKDIRIAVLGPFLHQHYLKTVKPLCALKTNCSLRLSWLLEIFPSSGTHTRINLSFKSSRKTTYHHLIGPKSIFYLKCYQGSSDRYDQQKMPLSPFIASH
ncbi:hypothetical protein AVEN_188074-1 [Araneus ventricosus]|uniref:Uncharacterized protein n=1 Tax=Araneus ventricosus TaxID=182803 RepID=A0A4Y2IES6_ARAVE|nr:hypothetical protein AVEN_188074-1 [Araneus ventricosus]